MARLDRRGQATRSQAMDLIDFPSLARNALWIIGLSVAFAAWSNNWWWARQQRDSLRHTLGLPRFVIPFSAGMSLLSASLAWGATRSWERVIWVVAGLLFAWDLAAHIRRRKVEAMDGTPISDK